MIEVMKGWFEKHFSDPQAIILIAILVLGAILVLYLGSILTPVLAGIVIAYVLEGLVCRFNQFGMPRLAAFLLSYTLFITALALLSYSAASGLVRAGISLIASWGLIRLPAGADSYPWRITATTHLPLPFSPRH